MAKKEEPAIGIPYTGNYHATQFHQQYYVGHNPHQAGAIPPNAFVGDPKGIPIHQTIFRDTPAPFNCVYCGNSSLTSVRYFFFFFLFISLLLFPLLFHYSFFFFFFFLLSISFY
ncbi:hypothetical protein CsSME_00021564 [Camellia sinensis var. sinensis]